MAESSTVAAFIDIDQTLMFSSTVVRRLGIDLEDLLIVETINDVPAGFVDQDLVGKLAELAEHALIVPATTRSLKQYERVVLFEPFGPKAAIVANGAVILIDGQIDEEWSRAVADRIESGGAPVAELAEVVARSNGGAVPGRVYLVESRFFCIVQDDRTSAETLLLTLAEAVGETGWTVSCQGRKVYVMPDTVSKGAAVDELVRRYGITGVAAAGDSVLDIDMLRRADLPVVPRHAAALNAILAELSPVVTGATGPRSSVEIVALMTSFARHTRMGAR